MQQLQQQVAEGLSAAASLQRDKQTAADQAHQVYICHSSALVDGLKTIPAQVTCPLTTTYQHLYDYQRRQCCSDMATHSEAKSEI